ncbi:PssE/Cps14G family polysaccharide biosynthesis glycosyltransferase [Paenibacillus gallinarum]|uniref:Beta(1,3)galactosyltransferase EpsH n=1 Tax=Paenibacillus gallinarum TaxID=2762232 RepID=A0ABR8T4X9_9BACL|nr:PssE/Cps14G family polysaccharide biosynthesis glycosyltransferase [Paenibacillus gallinarum]MBD7970810.1 beta(1,3)galactosyltransferase EpsH [Paenibacillus gallinarum]
MIFVTVGTQKFPFTRLFQMVEKLIQSHLITDEVIAQVGYTEYASDRMTIYKFLQETEMMENILASDIIITHAGVGTITNCLENNKKIIVVPRTMELGEHIDNHQMEITDVFKKKNLIMTANNQKDIERIFKNLEMVNLKNYVKTETSLISAIKDYVDQYN